MILLEYKNIHITFLIISLSCIFNLGLTATTHNQIDSTFVIPPKEKALQHISSYELIAKEKYSAKKYKESVTLYNKAIKIVKAYNLESSNKEIFRNLGRAYYKIQDYENTIQYISEYASDHPKITPEEKSFAMHRLSMAHRYLGDLESAFSYELINYQIVEKLNDIKLIWKSNYQLGSILTFQEDYAGSLDYFFKTENENEHIISVRDNGIGIAPEYKDKVFEIFRRLHNTSEYEGSGIGLATCKKIVERHDGKIWLDSKLQKGTTVYFSIPMSRNEVA